MKLSNKFPLTYQARVVRMRDGDTAQIVMDIGFGVHIERGFRLMDIESWELASEHRARAEQAAQALTELWRGADVVAHLSTRGFDCYGRLRGHLMLGEVSMSSEIVRLGHAWYERSRDRATTIRG